MLLLMTFASFWLIWSEKGKAQLYQNTNPIFGVSCAPGTPTALFSAFQGLVTHC